MTPVLLDAGPVVALLDKADGSHAFVRAAWSELSGGRPLVTTGAVVTEIMFQMQDIAGGPKRAAGFLSDAGVRVEEVFSGPSLQSAVAHMERYADTPMDFADATLVVLAAHFSTGDVLTLDERGFRTYRFLRNRAFRLLLQGAPGA
jgi:predicted nucleic acid-binding protein